MGDPEVVVRIAMWAWVMACAATGCALIYPYDDYERATDAGGADATGGHHSGGFSGASGFPSSGGKPDSDATSGGGSSGGTAGAAGAAAAGATISGGGGVTSGGGTTNGGGGAPTGGGGSPTGGGGVAGDGCIPKSCSTVPNPCGDVDDGCGNTLSCPADCGDPTVSCVNHSCVLVAGHACGAATCAAPGLTTLTLPVDSLCGCAPGVLCWYEPVADHVFGTSTLTVCPVNDAVITTDDCLGTAHLICAPP